MNVQCLRDQRKDCHNYLISITGVALGFLLFTFSLFLIMNLLMENTKSNLWNIFMDAASYVPIICGLYNGIWLFQKFIKKRSKTTKTIFAVLSIITLAIIYAGGMILLIPTYIYYICRYIYLLVKLRGDIAVN